MNKKSFLAVIIVAVMSFILALTMGVYVLITSLNVKERYVLYVGSETALSSNEIKYKTESVCRKYVRGYTVVEGAGGWTDDEDKFNSEKTVIYYFCDTTKATIEALAKEILQTVDGVAILMETVKTSSVHSSTGVFDN